MRLTTERGAGMTVLDMRDVRKVYRSGDIDIVALDHATVQVDHGEIVALLGPFRFGQDHAAVHRRRAAHAHRGHRRRRRATTSPSTTRSSSPSSVATTSASCSSR